MDVPLNLRWLQPGHIVFSSDDSSTVDLRRFRRLQITPDPRVTQRMAASPHQTKRLSTQIKNGEACTGPPRNWSRGNVTSPLGWQCQKRSPIDTMNYTLWQGCLSRSVPACLCPDVRFGTVTSQFVSNFVNCQRPTEVVALDFVTMMFPQE
jgi:hypothetical protein